MSPGPFCLMFLSGMWIMGWRAPSVLSVPRIPCPEYNFLTPHAISSSRPFWKWFRGFGDFFFGGFYPPPVIHSHFLTSFLPLLCVVLVSRSSNKDVCPRNCRSPHVLTPSPAKSFSFSWLQGHPVVSVWDTHSFISWELGAQWVSLWTTVYRGL